MGTVKLLWYFAWRMALLGLASGAALGGVYGAALLSIGGLYEEFSTNLPGAVSMGPVQVVLAAWLLAGFGAGFGALIGAPVGLALAGDWALHGFPDASTVVFWRLVPIETMESERGSNEGFWLVGVIPTLAAVLAMWWAGRKVAGWYARRNRGASG